MKITDLSILNSEDDDFQRNIIADMASGTGYCFDFQCKQWQAGARDCSWSEFKTVRCGSVRLEHA